MALTLDEELKRPLEALPFYELGKSLSAGGTAAFLGNFGCVARERSFWVVAVGLLTY